MTEVIARNRGRKKREKDDAFLLRIAERAKIKNYVTVKELENRYDRTRSAIINIIKKYDSELTVKDD